MRHNLASIDRLRNMAGYGIGFSSLTVDASVDFLDWLEEQGHLFSAMSNSAVYGMYLKYLKVAPNDYEDKP